MDTLDESRAELAREAAGLLSEAEGHLRDDKAEDAETRARDALAIFRELSDRPAVADALRIVISAMQMRDDYEEAAKLIYSELERFEEAEDRNGEAAMLLTMVEMNVDRRGSNVYEEVLSVATEAQEIYQEEGNRKMVAMVSLALCTLYSENGKGANMMQAANGALTLFRNIKDRKGEGQALHAVAVAAGMATKFADALKHSTSACKIFHELGFTRLEALEKQSLARWHKELHDYKLMLQSAEESLEIFQKLDSPSREVAAVGLVVEAHSLLGDQQEAIRIAQEALNRYETSGFLRGKAAVLEIMTSCYVAKRKTEEALESAGEALDIVRNMGDRKSEATLLMTISQVHLEAQNSDAARKSAEAAIDIMRELGDTSGEATALLNIVVNVHVTNNAHDKAMQIALEAMKIFQTLEDKKGEGAALLVAANILHMQGQLDDALSNVEVARQIFEDTGDMQMLARAMQALIAVNVALNNTEEATQLAYQGHVVSQKGKDKVLEVNMLFLVVQAQFAALKKFGDEGGARPSREFTDMWNKAEKAAMAASKLVVALNNKELAGNAAYVLGEVNLVNGKFKEALRGADESIAIYQEIDHKAGEGTALVLRAQTLKFLGRMEESLTAAQNGLSLGQECKDTRLQALAKELIDSIQGGARVQQPMMTEVMQAVEQPEAVPEASAVEEVMPKGLDPLIVTDMLHNMLREMMGMEVESDTPFMDAGVDSLMSIEFRSQVNQAFSGLSLSNTLTFDYPTLRELTGHVVEKSFE
mmetsp:Transcript_2311/g.6493  ORF Transcript_2311/g.6493 Transcript_2311/m.6493 type:complete len:761 (-) Transcript_2311:52-2334(-)